ncbi:MAG TPA: hypothetical protein VK151_09990 [Fluviicola sp.]|nr:hypothetical protein [Fluviicola sp.]
MKIFSLLLILLVTAPLSNAQVRKHKKKNSTAVGTLFFYWGYNRAYYTHSNIRFIGPDYDFKLKDVVAYDRPDKFRANLYFNPATLTVPQYNARIGYYLRDKWAISFGVDHYKYVMADHNEVLLDGFIADGVDTTWAGNYDDEPVVTDRNKFHYENTNGVNFLRFEVMRSFDLLEFGSQRQVALTGNLGAGLGPVLTYNDLNFAQLHTIATPSISGYGVGLNGSLRLEFFRHFFVAMESGLGLIHLVHVRTRPDDRDQFARQKFGFSSYFASAGVLIYLRPKNGCDSCPTW